MKIEGTRSAYDLLLTAGVISVFAVSLLAWESIPFRYTLVLLAFCAFLAPAYLRMTTRRLFVVISAAAIASVVIVGLQVHETLVLYGRLDVLLGKFARQLKNPAFQAWMVFMIVLALRYIYMRCIGSRPELESTIEGILLSISAMVAYVSSLSERVPIRAGGNSYAIPVVNVILLIVAAVFVYGIFKGARIVFLNRTMAYALILSPVLLVGAAIVLHTILRPHHGGTAAYVGRLARTMLGISVFALLVDVRASAQRHRRILKAAFTIIIGAILVLVWIHKMEIYQYIPRFDLFG